MHSVAIVLKRIGELATADRYAFLLGQGAPSERYVLLRANDEAAAAHPTLVIPEAERARLLAVPEGTSELPCVAEPYLYAVPVVVGSRFCGALVLGYDAPRRPDEEELSLLRGLADRIGLAIARRSETTSSIDALTQASAGTTRPSRSASGFAEPRTP